MRKFIEKSLIIAFCLLNAHKIQAQNLAFYFIISIIISLSLDLFRSKKIKLPIYLVFLGLLVYEPIFLYFLPLIIYNFYWDFKLFSFLALAFLGLIPPLNKFLVGLMAIYLTDTNYKFHVFLEENKKVRDGLKEDTIYLKKYNEQLKVDKEKNIHIAILTERNRIAREIHDSIGHTISSSILQVEAMKVISNPNILPELISLQETLSNGMNNIRDSIHNIYNESFDLKERIESMLEEMTNINGELLYNLEDDLSYELKFDILSIIKEALTNCIKHSNASKIRIILLSQPKFYSIVIKDNGSKFINTNKGIGLFLMEEIARKYKGFINHGFDKGFSLHLTLMKGE